MLMPNAGPPPAPTDSPRNCKQKTSGKTLPEVFYMYAQLY